MKSPKKEWLSFIPKNVRIPVFCSIYCVFECLNNRFESSLDQSNNVSKLQNVYHRKRFALGYQIIFEKPKLFKPRNQLCFGVSNVE